jgi:dimethylglycine dehydrogenase
MRWFAERLQGDGVEVRNVTEAFGGLALMGPRSRELLSLLAGEEISNAALPFMALTQLDLAFAPAMVARLSVSGELGYEIYVPAPYLASLLAAVLHAGGGHGARQVGMYALNSLRLEKSFGIWSREFSRDYTPAMCGLDRFIDYQKSDFVGRDAVLRDRDRAPDKRLVALAVQASDADASGYEPIWSGSELVGYVTSGGYGHCAETSLAMGYVNSSVAAGDGALSVTILGERRECRILTAAAIDPDGMRMRG